MRAAIYCRMSADRAGAGLGVDRQEADCRDLTERLGWDVVAVHVDNDVSAYSGKPRPEYKNLLGGIERGEIDAVIAWHPDRLHRRAAELEDFVTLCEEHGTAVQTVRAGAVDLGTASGRMVARMLGAAAMHEIDHARERMQRAKAQAAAEGRWRGGPRPFGYEADGVTVRPSEAALLLEAARGVIDGRSLGSLAKRLNEAGATGTRGQKFSSVHLRRLLLRPRNAGLMEVAGEIVGAGRWPAVIPEDIWRACRAVLSDRSRTTTPGPERRWLGSGIFRCGVCGGPLRATRSNDRVVYRCADSHVSRVQSMVDDYVEGVIREFLRRQDLGDLLGNDGQDADARVDIDRLEQLRARLAAFEADYAQGDITGRQLREATTRAEAEIAGVERQMATRARSNTLVRMASAADPVRFYDGASLDTRRAIVAMLVDVTIHQGRRGRPKGWMPGEPYSDLESVDVSWKESAK